MIYIANKRCKESTLYRKYGEDAIICDVTSRSPNYQLLRLSPFYPHGEIPVPFSDGIKAMCVESIWQGLKVFKNCDIDITLFSNATMKNLKRTVRKFGPIIGHRKGVNSEVILDYISARKLIYLPSYFWMLENKCNTILERLKEASKNKTIILLDYTTNSNPFDISRPLSHAYLIKSFVEGCYPNMIEESIKTEITNQPIQLLLWQD